MPGRQSAQDRQLVPCPLVDFRDCQLLGPTHDELGFLHRDQRGDQSSTLQQFDPHAIPGIEFLQLIARFGIIHPPVCQDTIDIGRE